MKLSTLGAEFSLIVDALTARGTLDMAESQGMVLRCPTCSAAPAPAGESYHLFLLWFAGRGVPDDRGPLRERWIPIGTGLGDLTLEGPAITAKCGARFSIRDGHVAPAPELAPARPLLASVP